MSTDGNTLDELEDEVGEAEEETPAKKLRDRLSNVPEVVVRHGKPKHNAKKGSKKKKTVAQPDAVALPDPGALRDAKVVEVEKAVKSMKMTHEAYKMTLGAKADKERATDMAAISQQFDDDQAIVDPSAAIIALTKTGVDAAQLDNAIFAEIEKFNSLGRIDVALVKSAAAVKAPKFGGINKLKDNGEKEFREKVGKPVEHFLAEVEPKLKTLVPLDEKEHKRLVELQAIVAIAEDEYGSTAAGIKPEKHEHERKLYDDYESHCKTLGKELAQLQTDNMSTPLIAHRALKREVDQAIEQLSKTVKLWQAIDQTEYDQARKKEAMLRDRYGDVYDDVDHSSPAQDLADADVAATPLLKDVKDYTRKLFESDDACGKLDTAVAAIGDKAGNSAEKEFVIEAFKARFDVDVFAGDLSKTNVMAFYKAFKMVPDSHTKGNAWLTKVERRKSLKDVTSFYSAPEKDVGVKPSGVVAIKAMRTSGPIEMIQNQIVAPMMFKNVQGSSRLDQFSWVTLHEIGHAVDQSDEFMKDAGNNADFGDWKEHDRTFIDKLIVKEFRHEFPNVPRGFVESFIACVLAGKKIQGEDKDKLEKIWKSELGTAAAVPADRTKLKSDLANDPGLQMAEVSRLRLGGLQWPSDDTAQSLSDAKLAIKLKGQERTIASLVLQQVLANQRLPLDSAIDDLLDTFPGNPADPNSIPDWDAFRKSTILKWYKNATFKEMGGVIEGIQQMTGKAAWIRSAKIPLSDGRIYHEAYEGDWVSYDATFRNNVLTDYQFRAPGEFFAESYAAFFLDKLPPGAVYGRLDLLQKKTKLKN